MATGSAEGRSEGRKGMAKGTQGQAIVEGKTGDEDRGRWIAGEGRKKNMGEMAEFRLIFSTRFNSVSESFDSDSTHDSQ